jgi:uncharacterized membrane protein
MDRFKKAVFSFWFLLTLLVFISGAFVAYYYRKMFGGDLSPLSSDWSAFGSYFGGVLSPLIAFCTLLAVLKTIYLQRELLDTQKAEMININNHQVAASAKQDAQLALAKEEMQVSKVQAYVATQLKLLDTIMAHFRREAEGMAGAISQIMAVKADFDEKKLAAEPSLKKKEEAERKIALLIALALELSFIEYDTTDAVRAAVGLKLLDILGVDYKSLAANIQAAESR